MKFLPTTIVSALLLCCIAQQATAQDALKILSNGNIGIGNQDPIARLQIGTPIGGTALSTTFITNAGRLGYEKGNELPLASIGFLNHSASTSLGIRAVRMAKDSVWTTSAIGLGMDMDNTVRAGGAALWFAPNGNIGIGTNTPQRMLEVAGSIKINRTDTLSVNNEIIFQDNGQIKSLDDNHRLIFNRTNDIMELREYGDIVFSSGARGGNGTRAMVLKANGRLGIGVPAPDATLHIANPTARTIFLMGVNGGSGGYTTFGIELTNVKGGYVNMQATKSSGSSWGNIVLNNEGGNVGIGTSNPSRARLVIDGYSSDNDIPLNDQLTFGNQVTRGTAGKKQLSLYATDGIAAKIIYLFSDERIKRSMQKSNAAADLQTLMGIEVTDFQYKDVMGQGNDSHKKLIAQQVESVFPQAVAKSTDVIPDIYQKATCKNGWIALATNLEKGDRVKLVTAKSKDIFEVLEVNPTGFRTNCQYEGSELFVYGREVNDFRTVDYEAVAMLNVSATQELARQLAALKKDNADMKARLAALEADSRKSTPAITKNITPDNKLAKMRK